MESIAIFLSVPSAYIQAAGIEAVCAKMREGPPHNIIVLVEGPRLLVMFG